ncbi:amidohydrolase [Geomicrobium sediminis]|uniref:Amidohydrolase n=1 Tax=Geomicrobium sediminis TaxID=1347788 RepID=A0ABS2PH15_9BACL|nr:amidohydrolase [Geomicrobium sediminis]MBM7634732.1 amidohydrolase [Geomicrobium sediminis]
MDEQTKHFNLINIYHDLHELAEISGEEYQTTRYLTNHLQQLGLHVHHFKTTTGLYVEVGHGKRIIALRADIDAVDQQVNGEWKANHSCGHDAHMTIALGVISNLLNRQSTLPEDHTYRFIFQPAEETGLGAMSLCKEGVIDDVSMLFGMHLRPIQELSSGQYSPAIQHGASRFMTGTITGDDAHGARPHLNVNSIQVGMDFVAKLNAMSLDPMATYSAKMTAFHAGGKSPNIIPGNAHFSLDLRADENDTMELLTANIMNIKDTLRSYYGVEIELTIGDDTPGAVIDEVAEAILSKAIVECVGEQNLKPRLHTPGSDDFHNYTIYHPALKATMLGIGCNLEPGLHHPAMHFDLDQLRAAVRILSHAMQIST